MHNMYMGTQIDRERDWERPGGGGLMVCSLTEVWFELFLYNIYESESPEMFSQCSFKTDSSKSDLGL